MLHQAWLMAPIRVAPALGVFQICVPKEPRRWDLRCDLIHLSVCDLFRGPNNCDPENKIGAFAIVYVRRNRRANPTAWGLTSHNLSPAMKLKTGKALNRR